MVSLEGTRTRANLMAAEAAGYSGLLAAIAAGNGEAAGFGMTRQDFAAEMNTMIEDNTAMYAGMARTARDEGFEEIADWFETLAKAGRSHARRIRRVVEMQKGFA